MNRTELILESDEWYSVNDDKELVIHNADGPPKKYPSTIYEIEGDVVYLLFDLSDCRWDPLILPEGHSYEVDSEDGDLYVLNATGECEDLIDCADYHIDRDSGIIYVYDEPSEDERGITYFADLDDGDEPAEDDQYGLFEGLPYVEACSTDGWRSGC